LGAGCSSGVADSSVTETFFTAHPWGCHGNLDRSIMTHIRFRDVPESTSEPMPPDAGPCPSTAAGSYAGVFARSVAIKPLMSSRAWRERIGSM
jgi:hypothetical protein